VPHVMMAAASGARVKVCDVFSTCVLSSLTSTRVSSGNGYVVIQSCSSSEEDEEEMLLYLDEGVLGLAEDYLLDDVEEDEED